MTVAVLADVLTPVVQPDLVAVTVTVIRLPASEDAMTYVLFVAPLIVLPSAFHWYASLVGFGDQVPVTAVSFFPTYPVPEIRGVGAFVKGRTTVAVLAEVRAVVV